MHKRMSNTKRACLAYGLLWIITIILRWIISDPEGTLSDLLTYWIVHPVAIAIVTAYIASEGMTWKKWLLPIGIAFFYALIDLFTGSLQYAINNHQGYINIASTLEIFRNGLLFAAIGTIVGIIVHASSTK